MANVIFSYTSRLVNSTLGYLRGLALLFCLSLPSILFADQWVNTEYNTTEGNEFYVTTMKNGGSSEGTAPNQRIYLYATARENTYICIKYNNGNDTILYIPKNGQNGTNILMEHVYTDASGSIEDINLSIKDKVEITIPQDKSAYVYTCDANGHMDTTKKVSLYLTNYHLSNGYDVTNVLPLEALERTYMIQTYREDNETTEFAIIATEDNQEFEMFLRLNKKQGDNKDTICYQEPNKITFKMMKGQTRLIRASYLRYSLTGTIICSKANFAVLNGDLGLKISNISHAFEQAYSTDKWGSEYVVTPTYNRSSKDQVILTAIEDGTVIEINGRKFVELQQGFSYMDEIDDAVFYKSNKKILCYLYENGRNNASPAMTTITPISMGVNSIVVAAFNATAQEVGVDAEEYKEIKDHYINVVTESAYRNDIYLGKTKVTGFKQVDNTKYWHTICQLDSAAVLKCNNPRGTLTARMYGDFFDEDDPVSYAYSAGSRVNRAVDMLINGKYTKYERVCLNKPSTFTSIINYDYDTLEWRVNDSIISNESEVTDFLFDTTGIFNLSLVVYSCSPICDCNEEHQLVDTVKAIVEVTALNHLTKSKDYCEGETFELQHKGNKYTFVADTSIQVWDGKEFQFKFDDPKNFMDTIRARSDDECDTVLKQTVAIHRKYNHSFDTTACDEWVWVDSLSKDRKKNYDTIQVFTIEPGDKLPVWKEHTHHFDSKYGCDSIVTWRVLLNKSYNFTETADACQVPGGVYEWEGHDTVHIPLDNPGRFTYTDYLSTKEEPYCDSIHRLILTINPRYESIDHDTICQNSGSYTWITAEGDTIKGEIKNDTTGTKLDANAIPTGQAGMFSYSQELKTENGCDSIHHLQLLINPIFDTVIVDSICDNDSYQLNETIIYSGDKSSKDSGVKLSAQDSPYHFIHTFPTQHGCDSTIHLELYVHPTFEEVIDTAVCQVEGGIFTWEGHGEVWSDDLQQIVNTIPIDQAGTFQYIDSLTTQHGCDNIYVLNLTVHPIFYSEQDTVLSNEDYIQWQGMVIGGKDVTSVALDYRVTQNITIDTTYSTISGCDSTFVLNITYGEVFRDTVYAAVCDNDSIYEWYYLNRKLKDIAVPTTAATYWFNETLKSPIGIDSLIYLELAVFPTYQIDTLDSICTTLPYSWRALDDDGNTNWIYDVQNKCMIDAGKIPTTLPAGQQTPQTFVYIDSLKTKACSTCPADGCDSVYMLHLTVLPQYEHIDTLAVCDNDSITWNGEWFYGYKLGKTTRSITNDTLIERTYSNEHGCLSYIKLQLYVLPTYLVVAPTDTTYQHICENETYATNYGKEYNKNGEWSTPNSIVSRYVIVDTIQTKACDSCYGIQCDSVVSHVIYVHPTYEYITTDTICQHDPYTWKVIDPEGNTNEIKNNIVDQNGQAINTIETDTHGTFEYLHFNTTADTLQCDSTHRLLLTILPRENTIDTLSMCDNDSVLWQRTNIWLYGDKSGASAAQIYAAQDDPHPIIQPANNAYGCDYEQILYLFVKAHSTADTTITICENHLPYVDPHTNQLYYQSTDYYDTIVNHVGCDSIIHINLLVTDTFQTHIDTTICESDAPYYYPDSRARNLQGLTRSGTYYDTIPTHLYGCDSIIELKLTINPTTIGKQTVVWCQSAGAYSHDNTELENLQNLTKSGIYRDTLNNINQHSCDSIVELTLEIVDSIVVHKYDTICDNYLPYNYPDTAAHNLQELRSTGEYRDTLISKLTGCDSVLVLHLQINPTYTTFVDSTICRNQTPWIWKTKDKYGEYPRIIDLNNEDSLPIVKYDSILLRSVHDCDSMVHLSLTICPTYQYEEVDTICQQIGGIYQWEGHENTIYSDTQKKQVTYIPLDNAGTFTYIDSLKTDTCTECGDVQCDSIHYLYLTILPTYRMVDTIVKMSEEEIYYWAENGKTYGGQKTTMDHDSTLYNDTTVIEHRLDTYPVGTYICDSIRVLEIIIGKVYRDTLQDEVCSNMPYQWIGKDKNGNDSVRMTIEHPQTMMYKDEHTTEMGFDSIFYLDLTVYPAYVGIDSMTISESTCLYSEYTWKRHNTDIPSQRLFSVAQQQWIDANHIPTDVVGTFTYIDSLKTKNGCDSVYTLILNIHEMYAITDTINICNDTFAIWQDTIYVGTQFTGQLPNDSMPVTTLAPQTNYYVNHTYKTIHGCDSIRYLCLNIHPLYNTIDYQKICDNQNPFIWETQDSYAKSIGVIYRDTITFEPSVLKPDSTKDIIYIDTIYRTLSSVHGCDSVVQLHLTIYPTYRFVTPARICSNDSIEWRGRFFNGTGADTLVTDLDTTQYGCDSIYQLDLRKIPAYENVYPYYLCANHSDTVYHYYNDKKDSIVIWIPNTYPLLEEKKMTFKTKDSGCDSIIIYKFHYFPVFHEATTHTICSTDTVQIHSDYIFTLPTTQKYFDPENETVLSIDTVIRDTIYSPNTYTNEYGQIDTCYCSSTYEATIRIYPAFKHVDIDTICSNEAYIWHSDTIRNLSVGDYHYTKTDTSIYGCDSIYELQLHINPIYNNIYYDTICNCDTYIFYGDTLRYSGLYHDTTQSVLTACDSISTLHLIVYDTTLNVVYDTICSPEKYEFLDSTFTEAGSYGFISTNLWGCRHHDSLYLTIVDTTAYDLYIGDVLCADDDELLVEYQIISGPELIEYSVLFDARGHAQGFQDIHHAPLDLNSNYFSIPIPKGEVLPHPTPTYFDSQQGVNQYTYEDKYAYPLPQKYHMTVIMHNGICGDTLQRKDTIFDLLYPSWIHEQHWNDGIVLYNEQYNGGHIFTSYQWLQNGEKIIGATKEYFYIPSELWMNNRGECKNYYQVELTRLSDGYKTITCPICPVVLGDTIVPREDYYSIVPTTVVKANPVVHILTTRPGTYVVYDLSGNMILNEPIAFIPDEKNYAGNIELPAVVGYYIVSMEMDNGDKRYVIVRVE